MEPSLAVTSSHVPKSCFLHYQLSPVKLVRGYRQYLLSDEGVRYLDCANTVAHVGHCHPKIVEAGLKYFEQVTIPVDETGFYKKYCDELTKDLPPSFDTVLFVASGSESNDLAIQMAQKYVGAEDVVSVAGSFYGDVSFSNFVSSKTSKDQRLVPKSWVHNIPCPETCRKWTLDKNKAGEFYAQQGIKQMKDLINKGKKISCFITEPILTTCGVVVPPSGWLCILANYVSSIKGLMIMDETNTGLGRTGSSMWGFQSSGICPDIITVGKPLASGYPVAAVITSSAIFQALGMDKNNFYPSPLSTMIGMCTLDVIKEENLLHQAKVIGKLILDKLLILKEKYYTIGDVRGVGMIIGVEIVHDRRQLDLRPYPKMAQEIVYGMKENKIIISTEGEHKNVLIMLPSLIFTEEEVDLLISSFDSVFCALHQIEDIPFEKYRRIIIENVIAANKLKVPLLSDDVD